MTGASGGTKPPLAIVTGATRGIGRHLAIGLAIRGFSVVAWGRKFQPVTDVVGDARRAAPDSPVKGAVADVTDRDAVQEAAARLVAEEGAPMLVVNCAGVIEPSDAPLWELDAKDIERVLTVNVMGPVNIMQAFLPSMIDAGRGRVVNVNSGAAVVSRPSYPGYNASKAALFRIGGSIDEAARGHGVRCFELAPGVVKTDMTASMPQWDDYADWTDPQASVELVTAIGRGLLDDFAGRMIRAGADTVESLRAAAANGLPDRARDLGLIGYGTHDGVGVTAPGHVQSS